MILVSPSLAVRDIQIDDILSSGGAMPVEEPIPGVVRKMPVAGKTLDVVPSGPESVSSISMSRKCVSPFCIWLETIRALTLILHRTRDGVIPIDSPRLLKERIPRSHLVYVYDAAHALDVDQPDRFARLITDFFAGGEAFIVNSSKSAATA